MIDGTMARLLKLAGTPADDVEGQAELRRVARLAAFKLASSGALDGLDDWTPVDERHDGVEAEWREMGMLPFFEWLCLWTPDVVAPDPSGVLLCYIRRGCPFPGGAFAVRAPFAKLRAAEGFTIRTVGVVLPESTVPGCWSLEVGTPDEVHVAPLKMVVTIPGHGDVVQTMTPTGSIIVEGPFNATAPDPETLAKARRALTMIPKGLGGRPEGTVKGRVVTDREFLEWYREASGAYAAEGRPVSLKDAATFLEVRSKTTAKKRIESLGLHWPLLQEELDELDE